MASEPALSLDQLPRCWNDTELLKHHPFSLFSVLAPDLTLPSTLKCAIVDEKEFSKVFIRWCLIAFQPPQYDRPNVMPGLENFAKEEMYWDLFVEVFYRIFRDKKGHSGLTALNKRRKELGYQYFILPQTTRYVQRSHMLPDQSIEAASDAFLATIPKDNRAMNINGPRQYRSLRRAAPPQHMLESLSHKNNESRTEIKSSNTERKRNRRREHRNRAVRQPEKTDSEKAAPNTGLGFPVKKALAHTEIHEVASCTTLQTESGFQEHAHREQTISVDDKTRLGVSCGHESTNGPLAVQQCRRVPDKKKQEPQVTPSSPKKRKVSDGREGQESPIEHFPPNVPPPCYDSFTAESLSKGNEITRSVQPRVNYSYVEFQTQPPIPPPPTCRQPETPDANAKHSVGSGIIKSTEAWSFYHSHASVVNSELSSSSHYSPSPFSVLQPSSISSDEIVLDKAIDGGCAEIDAARGAHTERDGVEDQARLDKLMAAYSMSRPEHCWPKPFLPEDKRPPMWAASRQALCETTSWFRCYHGGVYFSDGKAHGYLLGGYSSQRDVFSHDGRLIISHGGGKMMEGLEGLGQRDQDNSIRALLNNYRNRYPLALILDNRYAPFPFDLGERMYVVLGLYWIVGAWAEKDVCETDGKLGTRIKYKFAFQYCNGQGVPWWIGSSPGVSDSSLRGGDVTLGRNDVSEQATEDLSKTKCLSDVPVQNTQIASSSDNGFTEPNQMSDDTTPASNEGVCSHCDHSSPRIYKQGWMCTRPDCRDFFRINSEEAYLLDYDERFLKLRPPLDFGKIDLSIPSPLGIPGSHPDSIYSTKGWWCPRCGQLCPRERWECWACTTCNIRFPDTEPPPIRSHREFWDQESDLKGYSVYKIHQGSGINVSTKKWAVPDGQDSGLHYVFELPDNRGRIHLLSGNSQVNKRADALFQKYQEDARDPERPFLRRYPLRNHHARGRMLANYFSHNAGTPYKYAVNTNDTVPFEEAPESVNGALRLIKDRVTTVIHNDVNFNEILTAAYMAEQKMSYHTDDERGLGPVVASLSMGSIAHMHFRMRRTSAHTYPVQLTLILRHGDVLAMEGAAIQKLYEHTVVPMNFRIAATARYIDQNA